jgi:hypothetical protein
MTMELFHFSEERDIDIFIPRVKENRTNMPPVVWAIDDAHAFTFYFPRDCPRIVYTRNEEVTEKDNEKFFGLTCSDIVITVETHWYERIKNTTLYKYSMPPEHFQLFDESAGYYISTETTKPIHKEAISNLLERLIALKIDVRFTPNLNPLRDAILRSSLTDFGIHRFANASAL